MSNITNCGICSRLYKGLDHIVLYLIVEGFCVQFNSFFKRPIFKQINLSESFMSGDFIAKMLA